MSSAEAQTVRWTRWAESLLWISFSSAVHLPDPSLLYQKRGPPVHALDCMWFSRLLGQCTRLLSFPSFASSRLILGSSPSSSHSTQELILETRASRSNNQQKQNQKPLTICLRVHWLLTGFMFLFFPVTHPVPPLLTTSHLCHYGRPPAAFPLSHTLSNAGPSSLLPGWWPHRLWSILLIGNLQDPPLSVGCVSDFFICHGFCVQTPACPCSPLPGNGMPLCFGGGSLPSSWAPPFRYPQMCSGFLVSVIRIMFHPLPDIPPCCSLLIRSHPIFGADPPSSLKQSWISPPRSHRAGGFGRL